MAERASGRTSRSPSEKVTEPVASSNVTKSTDGSATGSANDPVSGDATARKPAKPLPSPRTGVDVNVETVRRAFATGDASLSVGYVQHVLRSRGLEPGNLNGIADQVTRRAFAELQASIGDEPTGLPTASSLDFLGFDVIG